LLGPVGSCCLFLAPAGSCWFLLARVSGGETPKGWGCLRSRASRAKLQVERRWFPFLASPPAGLFDSLGQPIQILRSGYFHGTHGPRHRGDHLAVEQSESSRREAAVQVNQRHLRSIVRSVEHRLAGKKSSHTNPINPAHQAALLPAFNTVGMTSLSQTFVRFEQTRGDPSGVHPAARDFGAGADHTREILVEGHLVWGSSQGSGQTPGNMHLTHLQHAAGFR